MLNNINLNLLRSLLVLLEEAHVSRAAQRLSITQSALSRQLAQCRELFSDPLLVRNGNELQKTPKAELLQSKLNALFIEFNDLIQESAFEPESWSGEVSFGCSDYVAQYIFPEIVEKISSIATQARFNYHFWQPHLLEGFADSPIKFASTLQSAIPKGLSGKLIGEDFQVCVMREGHPLSSKNTLTIDDILSYQHIIITGGGEKNVELDASLREQRLSRDIGLRVPFYSAAFNTLNKTDYLLIIPQHIAKNVSKHLLITYKNLPIELPLQKYWLIWHPKYDNDLAHKWVREQAYHILRHSIYSVGYEVKS